VQKTSSRQNIVPYKEIGVKESNASVKILTGSCQLVTYAHAQWKYGQNRPKCCQIAKIYDFYGKSWSLKTIMIFTVPRHTFMPSFILIHPTIWPQYTNVTDRQDRETDRQWSHSIRYGF